MTALTLISLILIALYTLLILRYRYSWRCYPEYRPGTRKGIPSLTLIVPFHNEETNLPALLYDLEKQDFPQEKMQVLLIDDHSSDASIRVASYFCHSRSNAGVLSLPEGKTGKKEALQLGLENARYDLITTTDADCRLGPSWLSSVASMYQEKMPAMIIGLVFPEEACKGLFGYFQQIELLSLAGAAAASAIRGRPVFCSGANLAYRKEILAGYGDPYFKSASSGDDTFLLLQIKGMYRQKIQVLKSKEAIVRTRLAKNPAEFMGQRSRWVSKSRYYRDPEIVYVSLLVFLTSLSLLQAAVLFLTGQQKWLFPVMTAIKISVDGLFITTLSEYAGIRFRLIPYMLSGLVYPVYLFTVFLRAFIYPLKWKGRKIS
jgi:cellulose synthase/poly-beta-1,6-N-acetylglucosamine synthase-like glycosyltransferase